MGRAGSADFRPDRESPLGRTSAGTGETYHCQEPFGYCTTDSKTERPRGFEAREFRSGGRGKTAELPVFILVSHPGNMAVKDEEFSRLRNRTLELLRAGEPKSDEVQALRRDLQAWGDRHGVKGTKWEFHPISEMPVQGGPGLGGRGRGGCLPVITVGDFVCVLEAGPAPGQGQCRYLCFTEGIRISV